MRIARGLLRLWLVASVGWIGLIGAVYWPIVSYEWKVFREKPIMFDDLPDAPWAINWDATHVAEASFYLAGARAGAWCGGGMGS
jgi:hypothetical protein